MGQFASPKQVAFIEKLAAERVGGTLYVKTQCNAWKVDCVEKLSGLAASNVIGVLLKEPKKEQAPKATVKVAEAGIYLFDGKVYKVQRAVRGSGNLYAKVLVTVAGEKGRFVYAPGMVTKLSPSDKMTLEQAKEFGALYGVCCSCGKTLTDEKSIEASIGPVCAKKF